MDRENTTMRRRINTELGTPQGPPTEPEMVVIPIGIASLGNGPFSMISCAYPPILSNMSLLTDVRTKNLHGCQASWQDAAHPTEVLAREGYTSNVSDSAAMRHCSLVWVGRKAGPHL